MKTRKAEGKIYVRNLKLKDFEVNSLIVNFKTVRVSNYRNK